MASKPKSFRPSSLPAPEERERQYDRQRDKQEWRGWYKSARWQKARAAHLAQHPFCKRCMTSGLLNPGTFKPDGTMQTDRRRMHLVVHHTVRHHGDPDVFWDAALWETSCPDHHDRDAQAEEKANIGR